MESEFYDIDEESTERLLWRKLMPPISAKYTVQGVKRTVLRLYMSKQNGHCVRNIYVDTTCNNNWSHTSLVILKLVALILF